MKIGCSGLNGDIGINFIIHVPSTYAKLRIVGTNYAVLRSYVFLHVLYIFDLVQSASVVMPYPAHSSHLSLYLKIELNLDTDSVYLIVQDIVLTWRFTSHL